MLVNQPIVLLLLSTYWVLIMYKVYVSTVYVVPIWFSWLLYETILHIKLLGSKKINDNEHVLMIKLYSHS